MPETNLSASNIMQTLMINKKIPSVRMVIGSVNIINIGLKIAFRIANTSTKTTAVE